MSDVYQRVQLTGEEQDQEQILAVLAAMQKGKLKNDLRLLNFYREVPVSYGASVEGVEKDFAELQVHQIQAVVIAQTKTVILKSSHFPRDVIAAVTYINVEKSRAIITKLGFGIVRADRRMSVRVEIGASLRGIFCTEVGEAEGTLHDMSVTGMSMKLSRDPGIPVSQEGQLAIALPTEVIDVPASLLKVLPTRDDCRLIFEIQPSRHAELRISQYIFQRQVEIIKELKEHPAVKK